MSSAFQSHLKRWKNKAGSYLNAGDRGPGVEREEKTPQLWVASVLGKALENYRKTVLNPVPVEEIILEEPILGNRLRAMGYGKIGVWGP